MKNILKVTILFCLIIGIFIVPSFADDVTYYDFSDYVLPSLGKYDNNNNLLNELRDSGTLLYTFPSYKYYYGGYVTDSLTISTIYYFRYSNTIVLASESGSAGFMSTFFNEDTQSWGSTSRTYTNTNKTNNNHTYKYSQINLDNRYTFGDMFQFNTINDGFNALSYYLDNPPTPTYTKNANVDEFIANTLISMGVKFDTPADALSYASDAWGWCIDEDNLDSANAFDKWNIESFVSYCNAQSNNYLNWYNGYKVSADVTKALGVYIRSNIQLLSGLPSGVSSLTPSYLPIGHYGSGFNSGATNPSAQTFYPAQTITYFNGEYVNETNDISTSQFLYTPPDVRRFLGYPGSSPAITPSSPTGTGTITDDPNNPDQKNININFPALDWLADAIKSILEFLRDAFTTLANLLTQLLDAILGLFSDAFEGLTEFGEGFIEFLQTVFTGFSEVLSGFVPTDIATILVTFLALNIGLGLITFVLKGH